MEAIIVRNDEFEIVGLHIYTDGRKAENRIDLFHWGCSGDFYYSKTKELYKAEEKALVKRLVEIEQAISCYKQFTWDIFTILKQQDRKMLKNGEGLKLQLIDDKIKELETERQNIIMQFK